MAQKKITEFPLRTDFDETVNLVGDDTVQTWRMTGQQVKNFVQALIVQNKAIDYAVDKEDDIIRSSGNVTHTMPDATTCPGKEFVIKKTDAAGTTTTIAFQIGQSADGETTLSLTERYSFWRLCSNGVTYDIVGAL